MRITHETKYDNCPEFKNLVDNASPGDAYIYSTPDRIIFSYDKFGNPQSTIFIVSEVEPISERFGKTDRILRGAWYCFNAEGDKIHFVEKKSVWCSQLANTDKFCGDIQKYIENK